MPPNQLFHASRPIGTVLKPDKRGRGTPLIGDVDKIGVGRYDSEPTCFCVIPDSFVWGEPLEAGFKYVHRPWEKLSESTGKLRRR